MHADLSESKSDAIISLVAAYTDQEIAACYWKSTIGLDDALTDVDKDVDLLVSKTSPKILVDLGFKKFLPPRRFALSGVTHWLKPTAEGLCHVDLHETIYTGETTPFTHAIPWAEVLLRNRVFDHAIPTIDPDLAFLVLLVRFGFEVKVKTDDVRDAFSKCDPMRVAEFATLLLGTKPSKKLMGLIEKDALKRDAIRTIISPRLTRFRSVRVAKARNTVRRARGIGRKAYELTKYEALPELLPPTRGLHREGRGLVFVVNADPSIVSGLDQWLRSWFDVHSFMSRDPRVQSLVNRGAIVLATDYELPDHVLMTDASEAPYTGAHIHRVKDLEHAKQIVWDAL